MMKVVCKKRKLEQETESDPEPENQEPDEQEEPNQLPHEGEQNEQVEPEHFDLQCDNCGHKLKLNLKQRKRLRREGFIQMVTESDASCFQYTGVPSVALLKHIFSWLKPAAEKIKLWDGKKKQYTTGKSGARKRKALTLFEEFVLTLVRIRRGYDVVLLSFLFGITTSQVGRVVPAWVNFLAKCLRPLIKWPSRKHVQENLPKSFTEFPRTRVIIDCTEIFVEKAFRPSAQRATWSSYKHSNTFKLLVGIMPSGAITFVSKLYSGSISDQKIVEKSGMIDNLENGDDVMADRGFNIRHLVLPKGATLNIPSFTYGKRLSTKAIKRSRKIARVRIHVERAIRRMKTFRILSGVIPIRLRFQLNQIITIVTVLCNLQDRLA